MFTMIRGAWRAPLLGPAHIVIGKPVVRGNKFTILNDASTIAHLPGAG
jgi:hypothetical protein